MPTYAVECHECGHSEDRRLSFTEYDQAKQGLVALPCPKCTCQMVLGFSPGTIGLVLKDGPSGGWASKAIRENNYRKTRRVEMTRRERDHVFKSKLVPNYKGEETGTWKEAREAARSEMGGAVAETYNPLVSREEGPT